MSGLSPPSTAHTDTQIPLFYDDIEEDDRRRLQEKKDAEAATADVDPGI